MLRRCGHILTKELAIQILRGEVLCTNEQTHEAVFMAIKALKNEQKQGELCDFCSNYGLEDGDTLYISADWDGGVAFDYIRDIHYCPKCGRKLTTQS